MQGSLYEFTLKGDDGNDKQYAVIEEARRDEEVRYVLFEEETRVIGIFIGRKIKTMNNEHFRFVLWNALECYDQLSDDGRIAVDETLAYLNANHEA